PLLEELIQRLKESGDYRGMQEAVELLPELYSLRNMSIGVAKYLDDGVDVDIIAALVKDMGTIFEKKIAEKARLILSRNPSLKSSDIYDRFMAQSILHGPGFTLRGGTTEILRGIVAKGVVAG